MGVKMETSWRKERRKTLATGLIKKGMKLREEERNGSRTKSWTGQGEEEEDHCRFVALSVRNCYGARRL